MTIRQAESINGPQLRRLIIIFIIALVVSSYAP